MVMLICWEHPSSTRTLHGYAHGPSSFLSKASRAVRSLQTPCQCTPQARGPGSVATRPWGSSAHCLTLQSNMPVGPLSSWHRTMGMAPPSGPFRRENDRQRETMQCLEYQIHWQVTLRTARELDWQKNSLSANLCGAGTFCFVVWCEPGRSWTPACKGSV